MFCSEHLQYTAEETVHNNGHTLSGLSREVTLRTHSTTSVQKKNIYLMLSDQTFVLLKTGISLELPTAIVASCCVAMVGLSTQQCFLKYFSSNFSFPMADFIFCYGEAWVEVEARLVIYTTTSF